MSENAANTKTDETPNGEPARRASDCYPRGCDGFAVVTTHRCDGFAVVTTDMSRHGNGVIMDETFAWSRSQAWSKAVGEYDRMFDAGDKVIISDDMPIPIRPFRIVGRYEYPRQKPRQTKIAWLRRRGCKVVAAQITAARNGG